MKEEEEEWGGAKSEYLDMQYDSLEVRHNNQELPAVNLLEASPKLRLNKVGEQSHRCIVCVKETCVRMHEECSSRVFVEQSHTGALTVGPVHRPNGSLESCRKYGSPRGFIDVE